MMNLDRPVTRRELREELQPFATKDELRQALQPFATKDELRQALRPFATKDELRQALQPFAMKDELRQALEAFPTRKEIDARFDELRVHFDVVAESFRSDFNNLYDWVLTNTKILATRVRHVEVGHGSRWQSLETRVMQLKKRRK